MKLAKFSPNFKLHVKLEITRTYPFECIFSRIDKDSTAIQATISEDILHMK